MYYTNPNRHLTPHLEFYLLDADPIPPDILSQVEEDLAIRLELHKGLARLCGIKAELQFLEMPNEHLASADNAGQIHEKRTALENERANLMDAQQQLNLRIQQNYAAGRWALAPQSYAKSSLLRDAQLDIQQLFAMRKKS